MLEQQKGDRVRRRRRDRRRDRPRFRRSGARVCLVGRTGPPLAAVAADIGTLGREPAETVVLDVLDGVAVNAYAAQVGDVDICVNAVGLEGGAQGMPLIEMSADTVVQPIADAARAAFNIAKAAAVHMTNGVIVMLSTPMARVPVATTGPFGSASAAVETMARQLAAELGPRGTRVVCLRLTGIPETATRLGSLTERMWRDAAARLGMSFEEVVQAAGAGSPLGRSADRRQGRRAGGVRRLGSRHGPDRHSPQRIRRRGRS